MEYPYIPGDKLETEWSDKYNSYVAFLPEALQKYYRLDYNMMVASDREELQKVINELVGYYSKNHSRSFIILQDMLLMPWIIAWGPIIYRTPIDDYWTFGTFLIFSILIYALRSFYGSLCTELHLPHDIVLFPFKRYGIRNKIIFFHQQHKSLYS